tara:strand:+ start:5410 stop:8367 length:2958 start_codon:yes stop_codon:yes gene_type:complete
MSVKIEILDYNYSVTELSQFNPDQSFNSPASWTIDPAGSWTISSGDATKISGTAGHISIPMIFTEGNHYRIKYKISGITSGSFILANHLAGNQDGFNTSTNGTFSYDWVQGANNTTKLSIFGTATCDGTLEYAFVYPLTDIDWENSVVGELDVTDHTDFPLALTFQIADFKNLTATTGDYSKTFKVPATKNNNKLLKYLYNPASINDNKLTERKPCRILVNNLYSLVGLIQIDGSGGYGENALYYNCVFFGSNLNWSKLLEEELLNDVDLWTDSTGLKYNKTDIMNTWQDVDCNSSSSNIVYPLTAYGNYNETGDARTVQLLDTESDALNLSDPAKVGYYGYESTSPIPLAFGTPVPSADWRPGVFVKSTLDKIFKKIGYRLSSTFMDSDIFKRLIWLLPNFKYNNPDERTIEFSYGNKFKDEGKIESFVLTAPPSSSSQWTDRNIDLNDAGADFVLGNNNNTGWDASTGIYTVQEYGFHTIDLNSFGVYMKYISGGSGLATIPYLNLRVQVKTVGNTSFKTILTSLTSDASMGVGYTIFEFHRTFPNRSETRYLNKGDQLRLQLSIKHKNSSSVGDPDTLIDISLFGASRPTSLTTSNAANASYSIAIEPTQVAYGQTYDLDKVINEEYKQTDFIKGIAHAFNLQMTTDEGTKTITIEPFNEFYKGYGQAIDWTYKLDRSNETVDKWDDVDLKRDLIFKYKSDDNDGMVEYRGNQFFDEVHDEYPYKQKLNKRFQSGTSEFENPFFSGTFSGKNSDTTQVITDTAFSGGLFTERVFMQSEARPDKGFDFEPRLLYWNKYSPSGVTSSFAKYARVQTWESAIQQISADSSFTGLSGIFPQATMINQDDISSPNLAYGNAWVRDYDDATTTYASPVVSKGLYDTYYYSMFEMIKSNPRLRISKFSLDIRDIVELDFTKLIYVDGSYWRLNRVVDYSPNKNISTKVELIEWEEVGAFAATAPIFGSSGQTAAWGLPVEDGNFDNQGL